MSLVSLVFAALVGCGGGEAADQAAPAEGSVTEAAPAAEGTAAAPAEGEAAATEAAPAADAAAAGLTKAKLDDAAKAVFAFQPWAEAEGKLKDLGPATKVEGDNHIWLAKDGEACVGLTVQKMGDSVGSAAVAPATGC